MATQPANQVAVIPTNNQSNFEVMQREARLFSASPLIPQHLRQGGPEQALANCYIALKMAKTMGEDPLVVLQNIHVVSGKAGFASQYMIARANASGVFKGRINWKVDKSDPKNLSVTAYATLAETEEVVEFTVDMAMAKAENWTKNAKYNTMPEVMLRYRSAAFLIRFYAPDVMLGYHTSDEIEDVAAVSGPVIESKPLTTEMLTAQAAPQTEQQDEEPEAEDAEIETVEAEEVADAPPYAETVAKIEAMIEAAKEADDITAADAEFQKHAAALPDDVASDLDGKLATARKKVRETA